MLSEHDKAKFLAALPEMVAFAKVQEFQLTKQEVESFFSNIALTEEHYKQIYAYLLANQIQVKDTVSSWKDVQKYEKRKESSSVISDKKKTEKIEEKAIEKKTSPYLQMYLQELKLVPVFSKEEEFDLYTRFLQGDRSVRDRLAEGKLHRVVEIVREYVDDCLVTEDLIQEGNMGLLTALSELFQAKTPENCADMIDDYIRQSVALAADEQISVKDQEQRILAKINLVHEAAKALAEEMGRIATIQELMEYTRLSIEEIEDIINLSEGGIDVGTGDISPDEEDTKLITWDFK